MKEEPPNQILGAPFDDYGEGETQTGPRVSILQDEPPSRSWSVSDDETRVSIVRVSLADIDLMESLRVLQIEAAENIEFRELMLIDVLFGHKIGSKFLSFWTSWFYRIALFVGSITLVLVLVYPEFEIQMATLIGVMSFCLLPLVHIDLVWRTFQHIETYHVLYLYFLIRACEISLFELQSSAAQYLVAHSFIALMLILLETLPQKLVKKSFRTWTYFLSTIYYVSTLVKTILIPFQQESSFRIHNLRIYVSGTYAFANASFALWLLKFTIRTTMYPKEYIFIGGHIFSILVQERRSVVRNILNDK